MEPEKNEGKAERKGLGSNHLFAYVMQLALFASFGRHLQDTVLKVLISFHSHLCDIIFKKRKIKYLLTTMLTSFFLSEYKEMIIKSLNLIPEKL